MSLQHTLEPRPIESYRLRCYKCTRWFELPAPVVQAVQVSWTAVATGEPLPFNTTPCTHCGTVNIAPVPGKYDRINTGRPTVQDVRCAPFTTRRALRGLQTRIRNARIRNGR